MTMRIEDILNDEGLEKTKIHTCNNANLDQLNNNNNKKSDEDEDERLMDIKSLLKLQDEDDSGERDLDDKKEAGGTIPDVLLHELDRIIIESASATKCSLSSSSESSSDEEGEEEDDEEEENSSTTSSAYESYSPLCVIVEEDEEDEEDDSDCASSCSSDATITEATVGGKDGESSGSINSSSSSSSSSNGSSEGGDDDKEIDSSCDDDGVGSFRHARTRGTGISTLTTNNSPVCCPEPQQPPPEESGAREKDQKESSSSGSGSGGHRNNYQVLQPPASEYFVIKFLAQEQQRQLDLIDLSKLCGETKESDEVEVSESNNGSIKRKHRSSLIRNDEEEDNGKDDDDGFEIVGRENGLKELSRFIEENTAGSYFDLNCEQDNNFNEEGSEEVETQIKDLHEICSENKTNDKAMHQRLSSSASVVVCGTVGNDPNSATQPHILAHLHVPSTRKPRSVLRKPSLVGVKKHSRNVSFNESLNLFYEAECQCWIHEDDYARLRQEEQAQSLYEHALQAHAHHHHNQQQQLPGHHHHFIHNPHYDPPPLEFEDTPTLSPPEGYKDRFFPQHDPPLPPGLDPDVTRVSPPSPPAARRKIFLKDGLTESQYEEQLQAHLAHHMATHHHHHHHPPQQQLQQHQQQRPPILNGLDEEEDEDGKKKGSRFGGILKGGRLWRSNSSESKKVVTSPSEEPDVVKCTEKDARLPDKDGQSQGNSVQIQTSQSSETQSSDSSGVVYGPTKVSTGTATLRTSEQIRLAVDSTLRLSRSKKNKQECSSSLVEKLRWLTSLDDDDSSDSQSGFATWPSRDKNGLTNPSSGNSSTSSSGGGRKSDAGTSTSDQEFVLSAIRHPPSIASANEAKIKQISYTLEDIDEGLKGGENELETFITEDGARIERIRKRYGSEDIGGDDYGFSRRPSVKGIKPKFSSTNQIFAQFTAMRAGGAETPIPQMMSESQYENTREIQNIQQQMSHPQSHYEPLPIPQQPGGLPNTVVDGVARVNLNYDQYTTPPPNSTNVNNPGNNSLVGNPTMTPVPGRSAEESRSHFEMIRQSFEQASYVNYNRPHSWSVSTLPHPHQHHQQQQQQQQQQQNSMIPGPGQHIPLPGMTNNLSGSSLSIMSQPQQQSGMVVVGGPPQGQPQQPQNNLSTGQPNGGPGGMMMNGPPVNANNGNNTRPNSMPMMPQPLYGTLPGNNGQQQMMQQQGGQQQPIYGTVRRVPNVIGRPLFLHYGALSVEAHPNKLVQPYPSPAPGVKVPETPSPTQQPPPIKYYGPPIRYYNPPPPVPPRSATTTIGTGPGPEGSNCIGGVPLERGNPEGATDEEPSIKEPYAMNV